MNGQLPQRWKRITIVAPAVRNTIGALEERYRKDERGEDYRRKIRDKNIFKPLKHFKPFASTSVAFAPRHRGQDERQEIKKMKEEKTKDER